MSEEKEAAQPPPPLYNSEELFDVLDVLTWRPVRQEKRGVVHRTGLLHQSVNLFVYREDPATKEAFGQILIQRRSAQKSVCPLHWDLSCAEHLQVGESHVDGAYRGAQEELGLVVPDACKPNNPLEVVRGPHLSYSSYPLRRVLDNELVVTFALHVLEFRDSEVEVDGVEVCAHAWESWREVWADMASETPAREYCPWFVEDMRYFVHFITLKGELQEPEERKQSN